MNQVTFTVNGIYNDTEKLQLKKALEKIDGVREIAIDRVDRTIAVDFNEPATEKDIKDCIESTGHEVIS